MNEPAVDEFNFEIMSTVKSPFALLRHPQVLKLAIDTLINPKKQLPLLEKKK